MSHRTVREQWARCVGEVIKEREVQTCCGGTDASRAGRTHGAESSDRRTGRGRTTQRALVADRWFIFKTRADAYFCMASWIGYAE